ncbi:hypothetical protein D3C81_2006850 [compost metagenome]
MQISMSSGARDRNLSDSAVPDFLRLANSGCLFSCHETRHGPPAPGVSPQSVFLRHRPDRAGDRRQRRPSPGQRLDDLDDLRGPGADAVRVWRE